jgi:hypothetical protein
MKSDQTKLPQSVEDVEGPWTDPNFESGLIQRCRRYWSTPISDLPNEALATYLRQGIALALLIPEAQRRIAVGYDDNAELYEGELASALKSAQGQL